MAAKETACTGYVQAVLIDSVTRLEAPAVELDTRIGDGDKPNVLVTGAHVGNIDAQSFQAILQLLEVEILIA